MSQAFKYVGTRCAHGQSCIFFQEKKCKHDFHDSSCYHSLVRNPEDDTQSLCVNGVNCKLHHPARVSGYSKYWVTKNNEVFYFEDPGFGTSRKYYNDPYNTTDVPADVFLDSATQTKAIKPKSAARQCEVSTSTSAKAPSGKSAWTRPPKITPDDKSSLDHKNTELDAQAPPEDYVVPAIVEINRRMLDVQQQIFLPGFSNESFEPLDQAIKDEMDRLIAAIKHMQDIENQRTALKAAAATYKASLASANNSA
jgi:hypothetical protein